MLTGEDKSELFFFSLSSLIDQYNVSLNTVRNRRTNGMAKWSNLFWRSEQKKLSI